MGDNDSSLVLHCSGVFSHKIPFASCGLSNSRMIALDSAAAFLSIYKKKQQQKNWGMTAVPYCYSLRG